MSRIYFGYIVTNEGTPRQNVRVLVAASVRGLEAQAYLMGERLRGDDYISSFDDLHDYDEECIDEARYQREVIE